MKVIRGIKLMACMMLGFFFMSCNPNESKRKVDSEGNFEIKQRRNELLAGVYKAVCYSGFREGQHPDRGQGAVNPSRQETLEDLKILSKEGFQLIRMYDTGENSKTVLELIAEHNLDMQVMLGIWLSAELCTYGSCVWLTAPYTEEEMRVNKRNNNIQIEQGIALANKYKDIVVAVNVGNEALVTWNDHLVHVDTMISYVRRVKSGIKQPVTVAENYEWWAAYGQKLAEELDFISIHIYPIWEGRDIAEGILYSIENVQKVRNALPNATIVISEAGWATTASEFGDRASELKQKEYYEWIMNWSKDMNITTFFFSAFDEPWKGNPYDKYGAEKHWGLFFVDRTPKLVLRRN